MAARAFLRGDELVTNAEYGPEITRFPTENRFLYSHGEDARKLAGCRSSLWDELIDHRSSIGVRPIVAGLGR
jgi:hypothetical protein